jgi:outer membrane protein assembly factor BamD (BamD/ComL family)
MSVTGLLSSFLGYNNSPLQQLQQKQQLQQEFQQLGQDLQSGNLTAAQSDIATLQKNSIFANATSASASSSQTTNSASQAFNQLSQDVQSGNLSAAKQDFLTLQQDLQGQQTGWAHDHYHGHHNWGAINQNSSGSQQNPITQIFGQLGQALQAGNLATAQQAYSTLAQDLQQFELGAGATAAQSAASTLSVTA